MPRAALGVDRGAAHLDGVVRALLGQGGHLGGVTRELGVLALGAHGVPVGEGGLQALGVAGLNLAGGVHALHEAGELLDGVGLDDPALVEGVVVPVLSGLQALDGAVGVEQAPVAGALVQLNLVEHGLVEDHPEGQVGVLVGLGVVALVVRPVGERGLADVVVHGGLFVHEPGAVLVHPEVVERVGVVALLGHGHGAADLLGGQAVGAGAPLAALEVPHGGAGSGADVDAVAGVVGGAPALLEDAGVVVPGLLGLAVLKAAGAHDDAVLGLDGLGGGAAVVGVLHAQDLAGQRVLHQARDGRAQAHLGALVLGDLGQGGKELVAGAGMALGSAVEHDGAVGGVTVGALTGALEEAEAQVLGEPGVHVLDHDVAEVVDGVLVGHAVEAHALRLLLDLVEVAAEGVVQVGGGAAEVAAVLDGGLLEDDGLHALLGGGDGSGHASGAVTGDHDVALLVPGGNPGLRGIDGLVGQGGLGGHGRGTCGDGDATGDEVPAGKLVSHLQSILLVFVGGPPAPPLGVCGTCSPRLAAPPV